MAKLTTKARNALPTNAFAGPDRSYPVQDWTHAANAKSRASAQYKQGKMSKAERDKIFAKANKKMASD